MAMIQGYTPTDWTFLPEGQKIFGVLARVPPRNKCKRGGFQEEYENFKGRTQSRGVWGHAPPPPQ